MASTLASGLTAARKAHDHDKGSVYVALFNLATGLERFFKAVVTAEHMALHALVAHQKNSSGSMVTTSEVFTTRAWSLAQSTVTR